MRKYAQIENGKIIAIFEYETEPICVPSIMMIEITLDTNRRIGDSYLDGTFFRVLEDEKIIAIGEIRMDAQAQVNALNKKYAPYEKETFATQQKEWEAWEVDNAHPTPRLDSMALARGIDRVVLLDKVGVNVDEVFQLTGMQHGKIDAVNACTTIEELEALITGESA